MVASRTLAEWLHYVERQHAQTIELGLDRVARVYDRLGVRIDCPVITVGGTNGKGSTCAILEAVLHASGFRTGLYTSPHLVRYGERVRIGAREVEDPGLRNHINITPFVVPRSEGKYGHYEFYKRRMNIVERFINKLMVSGHRGKKHKLSSGRQVGKTQMLYSQMKEAFVIIEKRTKKNPVQVLVKAVENSALLEEVASYRLGGIIARNSVITSPQRRLDLALRHLTQGIHRSSFRNRKSLSEVIADELIAASENDPKSFAILERNRIEKEAEGAR